MISQHFSLVLAFVCAVATTEAFVAVNHRPSSCCSPFHWQVLAKRGRGLSYLDDEDDTTGGSSGTRTKPKERSKRKSSAEKKKKKNKAIESSDGGVSATISPQLAQWMDLQESSGGDDGAPVDVEDADSSEEVAFQTFEQDLKKPESSSRREKQSSRKEQDERRNVKIDQALDVLDAALEETGNLESILTAVKGLLSLPSGATLRQLVAGKQQSNYRLAWVGSDDAICHVGTGLHKVPLARLQEVFMTCLGKNRLEVLEVIRILGPFPNVKNSLQGNAKLEENKQNFGGDSNSFKNLQIVMDSMVDGTGKEILAGTEDNIRRVNLQIYFSDKRAIVAVVPPEDGSLRADPLEDDGKNVLVFVKEDELDEKLNALRVL